jgi:hypothetical protein
MRTPPAEIARKVRALCNAHMAAQFDAAKDENTARDEQHACIVAQVEPLLAVLWTSDTDRRLIDAFISREDVTIALASGVETFTQSKLRAAMAVILEDYAEYVADRATSELTPAGWTHD